MTDDDNNVEALGRSFGCEYYASGGVLRITLWDAQTVMLI